jgi:hypothetical protein
MAMVTLTITDANVDDVSIHSVFSPRLSNPLTPAQRHCLDIIRRTSERWNIAIHDPQQIREAFENDALLDQVAMSVDAAVERVPSPDQDADRAAITLLVLDQLGIQAPCPVVLT